MKLLLRCVAGILLIGALLCVLLVALPDKYIKSLVVSITHSLTNRQLNISTLNLERSLNPRLILTEVTFGNTEWAGNEYLFSADKVSISIKLSQLLKGRFFIQDLSIAGTQLHLEIDESGKKNWQLSAEPRPLPSLQGLTIVLAGVTDALITFRDNRTSTDHRLILDEVSLANNLGEDNRLLKVSGKLNALPLSALLTLHANGLDRTSIFDVLMLPYEFDMTAGSMNIIATGQAIGADETLNAESELSIEIASMNQLGAMLNQQWPDVGLVKLDATATLTQSANVYDMELQKTRLTSDFIDVEVSGTVSDLLTTARTDVSIKLNTPDLSLIRRLFGVDMPPEWGPITATASIQGESGNYALNTIDARLDGESSARASGVIESLLPFDNMLLDVEVNLSTLGEVSTFTENPLPDIGPMTGTGVVGWQHGRLFLRDARASHKSQYGIAVVTGNIGDLIHFDKVRLRADAELPDFSALELFTGTALPDVEHIVVSTNLVSANALDLSARQLTVTVTRDGLSVVGTGAVESIIQGGSDVRLQLESNVASLDQLNTLSQTQLPELGPLQATALLMSSGQQFALNDIEVTLSDSNLSGTVTTQVEDLRVLDQLAFNVALQTNDVGALASKFGYGGQVNSPAEVNANLQIEGNNVHLEDTRINVDSNRVIGDLSIIDIFDSERRTRYTGNVTLVNADTTTLLKLTDTTQREESEPDGDSVQSKPAPTTTRVLSSEPLPIEFLQNDDIDLNVKITNFKSSLLDVTDATLELTALDGKLRLGPFSGTVNDGQVDLMMVVDTTSEPAHVDVSLALKAFNLSRAMVFKGTELIENTGGSWIDLSLAGKGNSIAEILGSATGEGGIYVEDLLVKENALSIFSSDLIDQLADALNPFADRMIMGTKLLCSATMFQIQDGLLETPFGFATEASDFSVVGDALVNFQDESLEMMFNPKPKNGLGISLNRLAGLVKLEGQIASPNLTLSETGLLQFGASIAAAVATGGVTLLAEGLYNKHTAMSDVCAKAMGQ